MTQKLYAFQKTVLNHYLKDRDVLLQAPTGSGKTLASIYPGIEGIAIAEEDNTLFRYPQRIIYGVPMRVLARSFYSEHDEIARSKHWRHHWRPSIQTGETPDDPLFEGRVIFATVDQMLASFLNVPYGIPKKLDNINAGAFIGAYLIFDEFHLYPREQMMLAVLAMLKMLKGISRFVLMSATFSPVLLKEIGDYLDAETIRDAPGTPIEAGIFQDVSPVRTRRRWLHAAEGELSPDAVLDKIRQHDARRVLCICNTVDRAQALFDALAGHEEINTHLIHSRMYQKDRRKVEDDLLEIYQQAGAGGKPEVLVATQVIEVGLDISSALMLTECAPAAALIQRAGRCARRQDEEGHVYVFQPFQDGVVNYAPYIEDGYEEVCIRTWKALREKFDDVEMTFAEEQAWVDQAHGEHDKVFIDDLSHKVNRRISQITECMHDRDTGYIGSLIRTSSNVPLLIHADPKEDETLATRPHELEAINISQSMIARAYEALHDDGGYDDLPFWFMGGKEEIDPDPESLTPNRTS
jgi:CRISPR-associated endonuclease/helicase Cas3